MNYLKIIVSSIMAQLLNDLFDEIEDKFLVLLPFFLLALQSPFHVPSDLLEDGHQLFLLVFSLALLLEKEGV